MRSVLHRFGLKTAAFMVICLFLVIATACDRFGQEGTLSSEGVYLPPSPVVSTLLPPEAIDSLAYPTPTVSCVDSLRFIADQTIPDGTEVERGATLDKVWEVENSGTCNYDERYRLKLIAGDELGAKPEQALFPARSGTRFEIHIRFIAPMEVGNVRSAWQAFDPQGNPFGDPIYIEIVVK